MKARTAVIITTGAIAIAIASMAFCIVQNNQRNKAYEKMYEQLRNQGYDNADAEVDSSDADSLGVDSTQVDTLRSMDTPDAETYKLANMAKEMLEELHYPIEQIDTIGDQLQINFLYGSEHMLAVAENNHPGIVVEDRPWDSFPSDNMLAMCAMWITINRVNSYFPFKILYYEDEDGVNVLTRHPLLLNEYTPEGAKLLEASVKNMVRVHEYFQDTMEAVMREMMERE